MSKKYKLFDYKKYDKLRDKQGLTNYRVAKLTGVSNAALSMWKNGNTEPRLEAAVKIATVLEVGLADILDDRLYEEAREEIEERTALETMEEACAGTETLRTYLDTLTVSKLKEWYAKNKDNVDYLITLATGAENDIA